MNLHDSMHPGLITNEDASPAVSLTKEDVPPGLLPSFRRSAQIPKTNLTLVGWKGSGAADVCHNYGRTSSHDRAIYPAFGRAMSPRMGTPMLSPSQRSAGSEHVNNAKFPYDPFEFMAERPPSQPHPHRSRATSPPLHPPRILPHQISPTRPHTSLDNASAYGSHDATALRIGRPVSTQIPASPIRRHGCMRIFRPLSQPQLTQIDGEIEKWHISDGGTREAIAAQQEDHPVGGSPSDESGDITQYVMGEIGAQEDSSSIHPRIGQRTMDTEEDY